jgi:hypothetical protein
MKPWRLLLTLLAAAALTGSSGPDDRQVTDPKSIQVIAFCVGLGRMGGCPCGMWPKPSAGLGLVSPSFQLGLSGGGDPPPNQSFTAVGPGR